MAQLDQVALDKLFDTLVARYRNQELSLATNVLSGDIAPPAPGDLTILPLPRTPERERLIALGRQALEKGELGVVILAGGMATRFQYDEPKGLFPILGSRSFLALKLEAVKALGSTVPVFLMTSFATDAAVRRHLVENRYFGLDPAQVTCFMQFQMPRLATAGGYFSEGGAVSYAAPGHGDFPAAFQASGALDAFLAGGGRWLLFSNVDNLGACVDLAIVGCHLASNQEMTVEVAPKRQGDQGGAPARVNGRLRLVEGFAFPADFDQGLIEVFNTANYVFTAGALNQVFQLPWYVVEKQVKGEKVVQFEHLAGDLSAELTTQFVVVERDERFLPVKNLADVPWVQGILAERWDERLALLGARC